MSRVIYEECGGRHTHENSVRLLTCLQGRSGQRLSSSIDSTSSELVCFKLELDVGRDFVDSLEDSDGLVHDLGACTGGQAPISYSSEEASYRFRLREERRCGSYACLVRYAESRGWLGTYDLGDIEASIAG